MKTNEIITYMRKLFVIISFVAFISGFMILSDSCGRQSMHETSERFEEALKCYDEAIDLFVNDSLRQSCYGWWRNSEKT